MSEADTELQKQLAGQVALLPGRIVLKRGAVEALLEMGQRVDKGSVLLDLRSIVGLPGFSSAQKVLGSVSGAGSLQMVQVVKEDALLRARTDKALFLRAVAYDLVLVASTDKSATLSALRAGYTDPRIVSSSAVHIPWTLAEKEAPKADIDYSWLAGVYGLDGVDTSSKEALEAFLQLPFPESRIATGGVLQPNTPDSTKAKVPLADGTEIVTSNDIYDEAQILLASRFWMAYTGGRITSGHMRQGGFDPGEDVRVLENFVTRGPVEIGSQSFKLGSWILSAWFPGDAAWARIESGEHNSWSLGSWFNFEIEQV